MRRGLLLIVAAGLVAAMSAPEAGAALTLGSTFVPADTCSDEVFIQSGSPFAHYAAPFAGVLTMWSYRADAAPPSQVRLKVARPAGGDDFTIVGESKSQAPTASVLNSYPTRVPVQAGDVIGLYVSDGPCAVAGPSQVGYSYHYIGGDPPPGTTATFNAGINGKFDVSATLEPDADCDALGDESQDFSVDPGGCAPPAPPTAEDTSPPDTAIANGPKAKTKKKAASFGFTSDEPGATFECRLDDRFGFGSCASPESITVSPGRHFLEVRAKDPAGNVDPTPATYSWKVKKKKKRN
jgi:hypothetical protein